MDNTLKLIGADADGLIFSTRYGESGTARHPHKAGATTEADYTAQEISDIIAALYLGQLKSQKYAELKAARDASYQGELITSKGHPFRAHLEAIIDVQMIIGLLPADDAVYSGYTGCDNVARDLTRADFAAALQEGAVRKMTAFAVWNAKRDAVAAATTEEELNAI